MPSDPSVAVLILNWNNYPDTNQCLSSLERLNYPNFEILLIDNGSQDGSPDMIQDHFPAIKIIRLKENLGFAGGNNHGLRYALKKEFDYCLLLNNDTELINLDMLTKLVGEAEKQPDIAAIGPKVKTKDGGWEDTILPYPTIAVTIRNTLGFYHNDLSIPQQVDSVAGACVLVRSEAIKDVGLFDENYFMYAEETEWFFRMRKAGWKVIYHPVESVIHYGASSSQRIENKLIYIERRANVIYTLVKHSHTVQAILQAIFMLLLLNLRIISAVMFSKSKSTNTYPWTMNGEIIAAFQEKWKMAVEMRYQPEKN